MFSLILLIINLSLFEFLNLEYLLINGIFGSHHPAELQIFAVLRRSSVIVNLLNTTFLLVKNFIYAIGSFSFKDTSVIPDQTLNSRLIGLNHDPQL
jgi:hypothetical protein